MCDPSMGNIDSFDVCGEGRNPNGKSPVHTGFELRGSKMYSFCDCRKRNGLQDSCPRTMNHGGNQNEMQGSGYESFQPQYEGMPARNFEMPSNGLGSRNVGYGGQMDAFPEYVSNVGGMQGYSMGQPNGMPDGSNWGGMPQGGQPGFFG